MKKQFATSLLLLALAVTAGARPLEVNKDYDPSQVIPVSLGGFTGEVESTLKFDLEVLGFKIVTADQARFQISGGNGEQVEGRVLEPASKQIVLARAFTGGGARNQAHALANEIIQTLRPGVKGIAQTRVAFKVDTGATSEIYIADYDGHNAVAMTRDATIVAAPTLGGGHLYYTSYKLGPPYLFSHNLATGQRELLARYPSLIGSAAVSPDGHHLAFVMGKEGRPDIYVIDATGANLHKVTSCRVGASSPCWAPDGRTICFSSTDAGSSSLYTVADTGGLMQRVRTAGVYNATEPDWSPDGRTIVFTTQIGGGGFEICTIPAGGGDAQRLVTGEDPSWAPNSRTVIFARRGRNEERRLSLLDVPTKQVKDVTKILGSNSQPSWAK